MQVCDIHIQKGKRIFNYKGVYNYNPLKNIYLCQDLTIQKMNV